MGLFNLLDSMICYLLVEVVSQDIDTVFHVICSYLHILPKFGYFLYPLNHILYLLRAYCGCAPSS